MILFEITCQFDFIGPDKINIKTEVNTCGISVDTDPTTDGKVTDKK